MEVSGVKEALVLAKRLLYIANMNDTKPVTEKNGKEKIWTTQSNI